MSSIQRYRRQSRFYGLGEDGQRRLTDATALIVGVGGLGSWTAEILARSGVGRLRLADDDIVELENIHRQTFYTEADQGRPKAVVAAERLGQINSEIAVETALERASAENIARLADGVDLIVDGTDNFATRFILNDLAVRDGVPWIFTGVLGAEAQTMTILPGQTACLRCVFDAPPGPGCEPGNAELGVLPSAVVTMCGLMATEAVKILAGRLDAVSPHLFKIDLWRNTTQRVAARRQADCPCCTKREFAFL